MKRLVDIVIQGCWNKSNSDVVNCTIDIKGITILNSAARDTKQRDSSEKKTFPRKYVSLHKAQLAAILKKIYKIRSW